MFTFSDIALCTWQYKTAQDKLHKNKASRIRKDYLYCQAERSKQGKQTGKGILKYFFKNYLLNVVHKYTYMD